mmetsp:Transcript_7255/g.9857  ORF Transcript_7255/g.9857 Transcript_7255/m.9857 type:complete len:364 (-) Transcript_7255:223-1314(-)|eukprot:CAMPEP_0185733484 /NCGR_PEP_ID=MMETSP1171-20130828/19653_1 /TAXON_ID=374046 /ORGANISM="Helicotheca tamensis, Strain CCMP826" /LENGTH=363 /DNA_ID=CAMNT_0028403233 /DNA_START=235 /DNA_END=1326 /DNA_ORIENTATION=-
MESNGLFPLLNINRYDIHGKEVLDSDAVITAVQQNPQAAAVKYIFTHDYGLHSYPLHHIFTLGAGMNVVEAIYNSFPPAIEEMCEEETVLHLAVKFRSSLDIIHFIFNKWPGAAHRKNQVGQTPLHIACSNGAPVEVVSLLLNSWPDASKEKSVDGRTPFHEACICKSSFDVMPLLLSRWPGVVKEKCNMGNTPLHWVCMHGQLEKIHFVLNNWPGAVREKNAFGELPLHSACETNQTKEVILMLLEHWPEAVREKSNFGKSPLDGFSHFGSSEVVATVLSHVSKLCGEVVDKTTSREIIAYFLEIKWYRGVGLLLDRLPSAFKQLNIDNMTLPDFLFMVGHQCKLTTLWHIVLNKQDILSDL